MRPVADSERDVSHIGGNASPEIKQALSNARAFYSSRLKRKVKGDTFFERVQERIKIMEISIGQKKDEPRKMEGSVVAELAIEKDMVNQYDQLHGGCCATLLTICSSVALHAIVMASATKNSDAEYSSVSQNINMVFHSPALLHDKLKIVTTTLALGSRTHSVIIEIWNMKGHRLVASGSEVKMVVSQPAPHL